MIEKSSLNTISWIELSKCRVMWRHSISTWRHEVKELTIHISASRCDRKMILFLFLWFFESQSSNMLLIFYLSDAVTSWRHVMTSQNLIYLSQLLDVLESWFFFCFHSFLTEFKHVIIFPFVWCRDVMTSCHDVTKPDLPITACRCARKFILFLFPWFFRSLSSKMLIISHLCFAVTSYRHVMTSLNLIYLSKLVDVLASWFFFCFHGFLGHWVQRCHLLFIFVIPWRHDVMSWRH